MSQGNVNVEVNGLVSILMKAFDKFTPLFISSSHKEAALWLTQEIGDSIRVRDSESSLADRNKNVLIQAEFCKHRNLLETKVRDSLG